jgi:hypothetical protein
MATALMMIAALGAALALSVLIIAACVLAVMALFWPAETKLMINRWVKRLTAGQNRAARH